MTYTIHDWMIDAGLRGGKLLTYALVYSYSRHGGGCYFGTEQFAADKTGLTTRQLRTIFAELARDGYLLKSSGFHDGRPTIDYVAVRPEKISKRPEEISDDDRKNFPVDAEKISGTDLYSHNKDDNGYSSYEENNQTRACAGEEEAPMVFVEEGGVAVKMTAAEHDKLVEEYGAEDAAGAIAYLSLYKGEKPYKTKSDYLAIRRWVIDAYRERKARKGTAPASSPLPSYEEERRAQKERSSERLRAANERLREAGIL